MANKSVVLHVGYNMIFTDDVKQLMTQYLGDKTKDLPGTAYYCQMFRQNQDQMIAWHDSKKYKDMSGFVKGFFVREGAQKKNKELVIVGYVVIDGLQLYAVFYNNTNAQPISIRKNACAGKYGPMIECNPSIKIQCTACCTYQ
jgi:hypothetical protein